MSNPQFFLIDAHALCYRSYFAIRDLSTGHGQPTNAVYGFVNALRKILRERRPGYMAVCFDAGKKTLRQEKFAQYKIQRPSMPDGLISQMRLIKDVVKAYRLAVFEVPGYEADDIIATLAAQIPRQYGLDAVIVSEDKDMYQLVNGQVSCFSGRLDAFYGYDDLKDMLGFPPGQIVDYIALAGDPADNIPGVKGIGRVTARQLVQAYGSLENILERLDSVAPLKVREKIAAQREMAVLCKSLAVLDTRVPLETDLEQLKVQPPDSPRLLTLFREMEFNKWAQELSEETAIAQQPRLTTRRIERSEDFVNLIKQIRVRKVCSLVVRRLPEPRLDREDGVFLALGTAEIFFVPLDEAAGLREIFEDPAVLKVVYDLKESLKNLSSIPSTLKNTFDVMLAGYLLGPAPSFFALNHLVWMYLQRTLPAEAGAETHAHVLDELYPFLLKELQEKSLAGLLEDIEMPLAHVLFSMEQHGVKVDVDLLGKLSRTCEQKIRELNAQLYQMAGEEFNLNSPKQLSHVLFEKLKLPALKKTKTGFSTDEDVLTRLAANHAFPQLLLEYRQLAKLKSTYIDALPRMVNARTTRIHAEFNQAGTETGRLSARQPNLQNIPIRTELGRDIRRAITASDENHILIAADYSQIELRVLAHLSGDENLKKAFQDGQDIHRYTASLIFDVPEAEVTHAMRDTAKRVNFGIIYGMSSFGLAKDLNISDEKAAEFIDKYFLRYPAVKGFMEGVIAACAASGYVTTILNRRRYIPEINSENMLVRQFAQRQAFNTPVQGSAADLIKAAMINIHRKIQEQKLQTKMVITVHDELVFDVPLHEQAAAAALIRQEMEHPLELSVPVKVSIKAGPNWMEMREVEF